MVWCCDIETRTLRPSKPENTGFSGNYYSVQDEDGAWHDDIDDWLTTVEDKAAPIYRRLLQGAVPEGQERADFATFVASLYCRSPSVMSAAAAGYARMLQDVMNVAWADRDRFEATIDDAVARGYVSDSADRDEVWDLFRDKKSHVLKVSQNRGLSMLAASDKIQRILFARNWYILEAAEDHFITCDSPVYRFVPEGHDFGAYGDGGFANPAAEITLPLSPSRGLLITGQDFGVQALALPAASVAMLNEMRASGAHQTLYSHRKDERLVDLADRFRGPGLILESSATGERAEVEVVRRLK